MTKKMAETCCSRCIRSVRGVMFALIMKTYIEKFTFIVLRGNAREGQSELYSLGRQSQSLAVRTRIPAILAQTIAVKPDAQLMRSVE
jgi:uncharacterized membrane protein